MPTLRLARARLRKPCGITVAAGILSLCGTGLAHAHVTARVDDPVRGASDVALSFRVPNETDDTPTTRLEVHLPLEHPLVGVLVRPHPGWQVTATTSRLPHPVTTDDGTITQAVTTVVWTARTTHDALAPGQSDDFVLTAGQLPDTGSLRFDAVQTYANGLVVHWTGTGAEAENPAPTVTLAAPTKRTRVDPTARVLGGAGVAAALGSVGLIATISGRRLRMAG